MLFYLLEFSKTNRKPLKYKVECLKRGVQYYPALCSISLPDGICREFALELKIDFFILNVISTFVANYYELL